MTVTDTDKAGLWAVDMKWSAFGTVWFRSALFNSYADAGEYRQHLHDRHRHEAEFRVVWLPDSEPLMHALFYGTNAEVVDDG